MIISKTPFIPDDTLKWIALCVLRDAEENKDGFGTIFFQRLERYLRREKERKLFGLPPQSRGNIKSGFAMISIIISLMLSLTLGLSGAIIISSRTDSIQAAISRELAEFTGMENYQIIHQGSRKSKEPVQFDGFETTGSPSAIPIEIKISNEIIRQYEQFKESDVAQLSEEKLFLVLLSYSFPRKTFEMPTLQNNSMELFKSNIATAVARLIPDAQFGESQKDTKKPLVLVKDGGNDWFIVPALRNLLEVTKRLPEDQRSFSANLFSEIYVGDNNKKVKLIWEGLRNLEMSNTGKDSLGMFAESTF